MGGRRCSGPTAACAVRSANNYVGARAFGRRLCPHRAATLMKRGKWVMWLGEARTVPASCRDHSGRRRSASSSPPLPPPSLHPDQSLKGAVWRACGRWDGCQEIGVPQYAALWSRTGRQRAIGEEPPWLTTNAAVVTFLLILQRRSFWRRGGSRRGESSGPQQETVRRAAARQRPRV